MWHRSRCVRRTLCKRRDANLDPPSLVFPTVRISLFTPISQNLILFFFFLVLWFGLDACSSLQEGDFIAEKLEEKPPSA